MGYTAETDWHLAFPSHDAVAACRAQLEAGIRYDTGWPRRWTFALPPGFDAATAQDWLGNVGEHAFADWIDRGALAGPVLVGSTSGTHRLDNWALDVIAAHAQGTIDGHGEDGALWRIRLHDGQASHHDGAVIYPSDRIGTTGSAPVAALNAAILALNTLRDPDATTGDQWDWLDTTAQTHLDHLTRLRDWVDTQGEDLHLDAPAAQERFSPPAGHASRGNPSGGPAPRSQLEPDPGQVARSATPAILGAATATPAAAAQGQGQAR